MAHRLMCQGGNQTLYDPTSSRQAGPRASGGRINDEGDASYTIYSCEG